MSNSSQNFEANKTGTNIEIVFMKADQITDIPFNDLAHTLVLTDKDLTISIPGYGLRGGNAAYEKMQELAKNSWGYYIVTAKEIVRDDKKYHSVADELSNIAIPGTSSTVDLKQIFCPSFAEKKLEDRPKLSPSKLKVFNSNINQDETFAHDGLTHDNIVMNGLDKIAGAVLLAKESKNENKIQNIVLIDDFVSNLVNAPQDVLKYLNKNNLGNKLADKVTVTCVWLNLECEIQAKNFKGSAGNEDSYKKQYEPQRQLFENKSLTLTPNEYIDRHRKIMQESLNIANTQPVVREVQIPQVLFAHSGKSEPIIDEAKQFMKKNSRNGEQFEAFKTKLGIGKDDVINDITAGGRMIKLNGELKNTVDLQKSALTTEQKIQPK